MFASASLITIHPLDHITGTDGDDRLVGTDGKDSIDGAQGNDVLLGLDGKDWLTGGAGDDLLKGGAGDDRLEGGPGLDTLVGGLGDDILGGVFTTALCLGGAGDDVVIGGAGATLNGGDGVDTFQLELFGTSSVSINLTPMANGREVHLFDGTTLLHVESGFLSMGAGDDQVTTSDADVTVLGNGGNDTINGWDTLVAHHLYGDDGDDIIEGGKLDDYLDGGRGEDTVSYARAAGAVQVSLRGYGGEVSGWGGSDSLVGFEHIIGSNSADVLTGSAHANRIVGGDGNDTIEGGYGADTLTGGRGHDLYVYSRLEASTAAGPDLVFLKPHDLIDLHQIDADAGTPKNDAFILVDSFTGHAGELAVTYDAESGLTRIEADVNGDAQADLVILAVGDHSGFAGFVL